MSPASMTGHGRGEARRGGVRASVEVSSVNRKQLDIQVRCDRALEGLVPQVQEEVARRITRGRVQVQIGCAGDSPKFRPEIRVDEALAGATAEALARTAERLGLSADLSARDLIAWPGVVTVVPHEATTEDAWPAVRAALRQALKAHGALRRTEGEALGRDLLGRVETLRKLVGRMEARVPAVREQLREQMRRRIREAGVDLADDDERLRKEIAFLAERSDVAEELTRLASHFDQAARLLRGRAPVGRTLDFLCQEMLRELNTIGSKSADLGMTRRVIEGKAELERLREQVQNLE